MGFPVRNNNEAHQGYIQQLKMEKYGLKLNSNSSRPDVIRPSKMEKYGLKLPINYFTDLQKDVNEDPKAGFFLKMDVKEIAYYATHVLAIITSIAIFAMKLKFRSETNAQENCIDMCNNGNSLFDCSCLVKY